ncbi:MAG: hypothetical protein R3C24_19955 [Cyanobacteriota/Melainabacteria group bacterium]
MEAEDGVVEAAVMIKAPLRELQFGDGSKIKVIKTASGFKGEKVKSYHRGQRPRHREDAFILRHIQSNRNKQEP